MAGNIIINFHKTTAAGSKEYIDLTDPDTTDDTGIRTRDHAPYCNVKIVNTGDATLMVKINNMRAGVVVPAGTIYEDEKYTIHAVEIENLDTTNTADYYVTLDNFPNLRHILMDLANAIRGFKGV